MVEKENSLFSNPLVLVVIAAAVILIGYVIYRQRTKQH